jgi:hypothetical protein
VQRQLPVLPQNGSARREDAGWTWQRVVDQTVGRDHVPTVLTNEPFVDVPARHLPLHQTERPTARWYNSTASSFEKMAGHLEAGVDIIASRSTASARAYEPPRGASATDLARAGFLRIWRDEVTSRAWCGCMIEYRNEA